MDNGRRLTSLLLSLDRLLFKDVQNFSADEYQQLRVLTSRILQNISSQEKRIRDIVLQSTNYLNRLLYLLEHSKDKTTTLNLISILTEAIGRTNTSKRLALLVSHGSIPILFHVIVSESKQTESSEDLLIAVHRLLARLGPKDNKFGIKARLHQTLGVTLNLLHSHSTHPEILLPVTQVLKLYAGDAVNASFLGKNGVVLYLFRIFSLCQRQHLLLLKSSLETLGRLVRCKGNANIAIGEGGVSILIDMFSDWHQYDTKNQNIGIRKAIVLALRNLTEFKSGQQAFFSADGFRILYFACKQETGVDCSELESLLCMASIVVRKCLPCSHLPLTSLDNPLVFDLPAKEFTDNYDSAKTAPVEESYKDDDDDISSDDDSCDVHITCESEDEEEFGVSFENYDKRSCDDLMSSYKPFFSELYEYDAMIERFDLEINNVDIFLSSTLNPRNKSLCRSSVDVIGDCVDDSSSSVTTLRSLREDFQQKQTMEVDIQSSHLSMPDLLHPESQPLFPPGKGSLENVWPATLNQIFSTSEGSDIFPYNPKLKQKSLSKAVNGKQREKMSKNGASESPVEDWLSFDESNRTSSKTTEDSGFKEKIMSGGCGDDYDDYAEEEDVSALMFSGRETVDERIKDPAVYRELASKTISIANFDKIAYPELFGHSVPPFKEPLYEKQLGVQRQLILEDIHRFINPERIIDCVVYDLDSIVLNQSKQSVPMTLTNDDERRVSIKKSKSGVLMFNSLFESGNLRKVIQIREHEYDLILTPDVNTNRFSQWFYFEVSNMERNVQYRFNIINCEKMNSQFNFGMQPVMFSVTEAMQGHAYWSRIGTKVCYYRNHFVRSSQTTGGIRGRNYYTASFTITFCHERDVCYIAYHYPYTYTLLQYHLKKWETTHDSANIYFRSQILCKSLGGNSVPLLTLTSKPAASYDRNSIYQMKNRPYIFLTSRVHPGESNASWVMKGTIDFLLSDHPTAKVLRETYIFKIVPMLNPDGVINGNHRCSLFAEDLNRRWFSPCPKRHPTIFHTKGLLQFLTNIDRAPLVFCDYHGHSRRKNVFLYGCSPCESWMKEDFDNPAVLQNQTEDSGYKTLPRILHAISPLFSLNSCSFAVERVKETTARVVVWRQMRVLRSYTMESTYCGCDQGIYKGKHINTRHLQKMGGKLVEALAKLKVKQLIHCSNIPSVRSDVSDDLPLLSDGWKTTKTASINLLDIGCNVSTLSDIDKYEPDLDNNIKYN